MDAPTSRPFKTRARRLQLLWAYGPDEDDSFLGTFALVLESYTDAEVIEVVA